MKNQILLVLLLFYSLLINAQKSKEAENFLVQYVKEHTKEPIFYTERIWPLYIEYIKTALEKEKTQLKDDSFTDLKGEFPTQIIFSKKELKYVTEEILKNDKEGWIKNKIPTSEFLAQDSIRKHTEKYKLYNFYSFSKPIFIRNDSVCIFYSDGNDAGRLATYIKINGIWRYYSSFFKFLN